MDILQFISAVGSPKVIAIVFVLGTVVGSFLNVVVYRLGTGERIGNTRSRCFSCGTTLRWYDLIPILSFLFQKGMCRYCGSKISIQYPIVEFVTGTVFTMIAWNILQDFQFSIFNFSAEGGSASGGQSIINDSIFKLLYFFIIFSLLIVISAYDFQHKIIPNQFAYPFIIFSFFFPIIHNSIFIIQDILENILSGISAFAFFGGLWFFSKGKWMGFGDAKLALGIGFFLGPWLIALAVILSFWIGTLIAVPMTLVRGGGLKTQIPFGPFLAVGCFVAWMWGESLFSWYFTLL